jgi:TRAP-type mannitol/chloroaromatic compound transport system permease large subunit
MALVFSIKQTGVPVGAMMAGALVPTMMLNIDWQMSLLVVALACLISAALAQLMRQSTDDQRQPSLP